MPNIAVDAGPLIALFSRRDRYHEAAKAFLARTESDTLVTNLLVAGEIAAILDANRTDLVESLRWLIENVEIDQHTVLDLPHTLDVVMKYRDLPADLADASLVVLCERRGTNLVATVDQDFDVYRLPKSKPFKNVFFDPP